MAFWPLVKYTSREGVTYQKSHVGLSRKSLFRNKGVLYKEIKIMFFWRSEISYDQNAHVKGKIELKKYKNGEKTSVRH